MLEAVSDEIPKVEVTNKIFTVAVWRQKRCWQCQMTVINEMLTAAVSNKSGSDRLDVDGVSDRWYVNNAVSDKMLTAPASRKIICNKLF